MRKLLVLLLLCVLLTGCSIMPPNFEGKWVTSVEDTLCAVVLTIEGSRFTLIQEGRTSTGRVVHDVGNYLLYEEVESPVQSGSVWGADYDEATDTLTLGEWTLYRE